MVAFVKSPPTDLYDGIEKDFHLLCLFFDKYVGKLYGKRHINKWLANHKGNSLLDLITMSDVAYVGAQIENSGDVWVQEYEICQQAKVKDFKELKKMPEDERPKYTPKTPKFTSRKGTKPKYLHHGWSQEGIAFYESVLATWKERAGDKDWWGMLEESWDNYLETTGSGHRWRERPATVARGTDGGEELAESRAVANNHFALPGDEDFQPDRAWKKPPPRGEVQDELMESESSSDEEEVAPKKAPGKKRSLEELESSSSESESESESEDESPVRAKRPKKRAAVSPTPRKERNM